MFSKAKSFFFSNVKTVFRYLFHFIRNKQKFEAGWLIFKAAQGKTQIWFSRMRAILPRFDWAKSKLSAKKPWI